jgi:hypothetical protein
MRSLRVAALCATLALAAAALAAAAKPTVVQMGWGPFSFNAGLSPRTLPRHHMAPIDVGFSGRLLSPDSNPPPLQEMAVQFDRHGAIDPSGLAACGRKQIEALNRAAARRACRKSIVGSGVAHVHLPTSPDAAIPVPLSVFNGGIRDGTTTVLIHGVVPTPVPTPAIATVKIEKHRSGRYGLRSLSTIPSIAGGAGSVLDFTIEIERRFMHEGEERSFAIARCGDSHLDLELIDFTFATGERFDGAVMKRSCTPSD